MFHRLKIERPNPPAPFYVSSKVLPSNGSAIMLYGNRVTETKNSWGLGQYRVRYEASDYGVGVEIYLHTWRSRDLAPDLFVWCLVDSIGYDEQEKVTHEEMQKAFDEEEVLTGRAEKRIFLEKQETCND